MFTGIIEEVGTVKLLVREGGNLHLTISAGMTPELKVDQSIAHNGACLTVVDIQDEDYTVTAISETVAKTNLGSLHEGDSINLERCMRIGDRIDGHMVQGHVDQQGTISSIEEQDGSWKYTIEYDSSIGNITVEKGSVCVNGVSLTVVDSTTSSFSVVIIPYTYKHTSFHQLKVGEKVNLEFDVIGKYVRRMLFDQLA